MLYCHLGSEEKSEKGGWFLFVVNPTPLNYKYSLNVNDGFPSWCFASWFQNGSANILDTKTSISFTYCANLNFVPESAVLLLHSRRDRTADSGALLGLWLKHPFL